MTFLLKLDPLIGSLQLIEGGGRRQSKVLIGHRHHWGAAALSASLLSPITASVWCSASGRF